MRKLTVFIVANGLLVIVLIALAVPVQADGPSRKRKPKKPAETVTMESLAELVRRAEQAATAAQAEAQRARQQTEALQQQLAQTAQELAALRQSLAESAPRAVASGGADSDESRENATATVRGADRQVSGTDSNPRSAIRDPQSAGDPQLAGRVATLEEQVEINTSQINEQAQTKVESDSRMRVRLSGMVLINTYLNSADSSARSTPTRAPAPADPLAQTGPNVGANLRQTILGLTMEGPRLAGGRLSAQTEFDFYGTNGDVFRGNPLGSLRLRTASARLDWDRTSLTLGLRPVMISPRDPSSLAMVWYPPLAGAGNLWQWRPQLILEHRPQLSDSSELVLQAGLMTPFGETLDSLPIEGTLQYQGRVAFRHNYDTERKLELGVAGLAGRRSFILDRKETTYVASSDWLIPLGGRLELSGEGYFGKANNLGEQSGLRADSYYALSGPIDNPTTVIRGIYAFGGWTQLSLKVRRDLDFNFALGIEDPRNRDVLSDRRTLTPYFKNQVASGNFIYQLRQNLLFSIEYRRLWTDYSAGRKRNDHYNLSVGYLF
jgi:hypothetical protein